MLEFWNLQDTFITLLWLYLIYPCHMRKKYLVCVYIYTWIRWRFPGCELQFTVRFDGVDEIMPHVLHRVIRCSYNQLEEDSLQTCSGHTYVAHYNDVTWPSCVSDHRKLTLCSTTCSGQHQRKHPSKLIAGRLWGESSGVRWIPSQMASGSESVSISLRHHGAPNLPPWKKMSGFLTSVPLACCSLYYCLATNKLIMLIRFTGLVAIAWLPRFQWDYPEK